jgi:hypothetical protein
LLKISGLNRHALETPYQKNWTSQFKTAGIPGHFENATKSCNFGSADQKNKIPTPFDSYNYPLQICYLRQKCRSKVKVTSSDLGAHKLKFEIERRHFFLF